MSASASSTCSRRCSCSRFRTRSANGWRKVIRSRCWCSPQRGCAVAVVFAHPQGRRNFGVAHQPARRAIRPRDDLGRLECRVILRLSPAASRRRDCADLRGAAIPNGALLADSARIGRVRALARGHGGVYRRLDHGASERSRELGRDAQCDTLRSLQCSGHIDSARTDPDRSAGFDRVALPILPVCWVTPSAIDLTLFCSIGLIGGVSQYRSTQALYYAPAAAVSPFNYTALIWGSIFGFVVWSEIPTRPMVVGVTRSHRDRSLPVAARGLQSGSGAA